MSKLSKTCKDFFREHYDSVCHVLDFAFKKINKTISNVCYFVFILKFKKILIFSLFFRDFTNLFLLDKLFLALTSTSLGQLGSV